MVALGTISKEIFQGRERTERGVEKLRQFIVPALGRNWHLTLLGEGCQRVIEPSLSPLLYKIVPEGLQINEDAAAIPNS
jgi:hypothetical protein